MNERDCTWPALHGSCGRCDVLRCCRGQEPDRSWLGTPSDSRDADQRRAEKVWAGWIERNGYMGPRRHSSVALRIAERLSAWLRWKGQECRAPYSSWACEARILGHEHPFDNTRAAGLRAEFITVHRAGINWELLAVTCDYLSEADSWALVHEWRPADATETHYKLRGEGIAYKERAAYGYGYVPNGVWIRPR